MGGLGLPWWAQAGLLFGVGFLAIKFLTAFGWLFIYVAVFLWLVVLLGFLHSRGKMPAAVLRVKFMKDILDRLTNKEALEEGLNERPSLYKRINAEELAGNLKGKIFGQNEVCEKIAWEIRNRFEEEKRKKPVGVYMFAGPPATGKTHFAKILSNELYNTPISGSNPGHIEMAQFDQPHTASSLFGQARGYSGSDQYGILTNLLKTKSDQVIILDEFEKAHDSVHKKFLSAWNDGFITEQSTGEKISTVDAIFIITTNAKQRQIASLAVQYEGNFDEYTLAAARELSDSFAPEVLSRVDDVFPFLPLKGLDLARIVASGIEESIDRYGVELEHIDPQVILHLLGKAQGPDSDARKIVKDISRSLANQIVDLKHNGIKSVRIEGDEDSIRVVPA